MGIGRVLGAAAPIAAGYFAGGGTPLFASLGSTGSAIAAGVLTGAGIAALSGEDALMGGITGGLGGMTGGGLNTAIQKASLSPGMTTGQLNKELLSPYTQAGGSLAGKGVGQASTMTAADATSGLATGGGYNPATGSFGASPVSNIAYTGQTSAMEPIQNALSRSTVTPGISDVAREFGGGSEAMGYGKMGLAGLGVAGGAGAFDPEPIKLSDSRDKYDPNARLDLSMDTGIDEALNRDTGLRLLAQGGSVKRFQTGGKTLGGEYTSDQLTKLATYGVVPQYKPSIMGAIIPREQFRQPVMGVIDVGGKFVGRPDGDLTDVDYVKRFDYILKDTTAENNQQGGGMDPNLAPGGQGDDAGLNPGAISALASGFAQQQMNPPTKSQTLGLESLQTGGQIKHYIGGGVVGAVPGGLGNNTRPGGMGGVIGAIPGGLGQTVASPNLITIGLAKAPQEMSGTPAPTGPTALNLNTGKQEPIKAYEQGNFESGGYLETGGEVGDGMSDEIEATIEGEQEARLSDGEFVIPADVVSHLGNGSSDAGAKRLYEMMDKIRMARTGTKKQGKEINPERYMPA
jgi:hypothetical protein